MDVQVIEVTPYMAADWLEKNDHNRRITTSTVYAYSEQMKEGLWRADGAPIRFSKDGRLLDGQHRLLAQIRAGQTLTHVVITGIEDIAQATMDTGKKRSLADALSMEGVGNSYGVAAVLTAIHRYEKGARGSMIFMAQSAKDNGHTVKVMEPIQPALDFFHKHEDEIVDIFHRAASVRRHVPLYPRVGGVGMWATSRINAEDSEDFFHKLTTGESLGANSPILRLRQSLFSLEQERGATPAGYKLALLTKAWNFYRDGDEVVNLRFRRGGAKPESFPTFR